VNLLELVVVVEREIPWVEISWSEALLCHERCRIGDVVVNEGLIAPPCRHALDPLDGMVEDHVETGTESQAPGCGITGFRSIHDTIVVTDGTVGFIDGTTLDEVMLLLQGFPGGNFSDGRRGCDEQACGGKARFEWSHKGVGLITIVNTKKQKKSGSSLFYVGKGKLSLPLIR
jgi:hypothetical protein